MPLATLALLTISWIEVFLSPLVVNNLNPSSRSLSSLLSLYVLVSLISLQFLLFNGYLGIAQNFMKITENISYHVAAGKISKELLHKIMTAIMDGTYEKDEELKLEIMNAIA